MENVTMERILAPKPEETDNTGVDGASFQAGIKLVEKIRPSTTRDGAFWKIHMEVCETKCVIEIANNDLMRGPSKFEDMFKSRFGFFLPYELTRKAKRGESSPWKLFQLYLEQIKIDVDPTESQEWFDCEILLENIAGMMWTDDKSTWIEKTKAKRLLLRDVFDGKVYFLLKTEDVASVVKEFNIATKLTALGGSLNNSGIKRDKNPTKRVGEKTLHPWWFSLESLVQHGFNEEKQKTSDENGECF